MPYLTKQMTPPLLISRVRQLEKQVGHTPLHPFNRLFSKKNVSLYAKKEWEQLSGSVKARAAFRIFKQAIETGELNARKTLLDATSGNTGIAYAAIGKQLGIAVSLCLPENASEERKEILRSLGAELILTSRFEGTDGAQLAAKQMATNEPDRYFYADQYKNNNNWKAHYYGTAIELIETIPNLTHFVAGLGTTGTFVGTGRRLKEHNKNIQLISLQPDLPLHGLEGWKHLDTAIVPTIYDATVADENFQVSTDDAYEMIKAVYKHEHILLSPSAAANLVGAITVAEKLDEGTVVTVLPDNADKYGEVIKRLGLTY